MQTQRSFDLHKRSRTPNTHVSKWGVAVNPIKENARWKCVCSLYYLWILWIFHSWLAAPIEKRCSSKQYSTYTLWFCASDPILNCQSFLSCFQSFPIFLSNRAKNDRKIRTSQPFPCQAELTQACPPHRHTPTDTLPHALLPSRGMQPLLSPSLHYPPQGLAPYPHFYAHYHPLLPYYHIWSTTSLRSPLPLLIHPPTCTTSKACPLFFGHSQGEEEEDEEAGAFMGNNLPGRWRMSGHSIKGCPLSLRSEPECGPLQRNGVPWIDCGPSWNIKERTDFPQYLYTSLCGDFSLHWAWNC